MPKISMTIFQIWMTCQIGKMKIRMKKLKNLSQNNSRNKIPNLISKIKRSKKVNQNSKKLFDLMILNRSLSMSSVTRHSSSYVSGFDGLMMSIILIKF